MKRILALLAIVFVVTGHASTLTGRIIRISVGDTITVLDSSFNQHKVRLTGIDAPESEQPFGTRSQQHLSALVFGKTVTVDYDEQDYYGRALGKVLVSGQDANLEQVQAGLAWHYKYYQSDQSPVDRVAYATAEIQAKQARLGLWSDPHAVPPWDWRKGNAQSRLTNRATPSSAAVLFAQPAAS